MGTKFQLPQGDVVTLPEGEHPYIQPVTYRRMDRRQKDWVHILCSCRPHVNFCGRFEPGEAGDEPINGSECPPCYQILQQQGCPNCGCKLDQCCPKCCEGEDCHD